MGRLVSASALVLLVCTLHLKIGKSEVSDNDLFPFGLGIGVGDDINTEVKLIIRFNFFNQTYNSIHLSSNGQVSFVQGLRNYAPNCSPGSIPMIMAFWADSAYANEAKLSFIQTRDRPLLQKAAADVYSAFPQLTGIRLNWMLIVSWQNFTFAGASRTCNGRSKRNTFQLVLTTDGYYSFAIMYYNRIEWTTGETVGSGGNCNGLDGNAAKVGFDYGDGKTFHTVPGSCTNEILNITQTSNINQPGKWVFRIDGNLETSTCEDFNSTTNKLLQVTPNVVSYVGIQPLKIEGPCLKRTASATCIFHDVLNKTEVDGLISDDFKDVICPLPLFQEFGRKKVELKLTHPSQPGAMEDSQIYAGYLYVVGENKEEDDLQISIATSRNFTTNTTEDNEDENEESVILNVAWNPTLFKTKSKVEIRLKINDGQNWIDLGVIEDALVNNGRWEGPIKKEVLRQYSIRFPNIERPLLAITLSSSNENERFGKKVSSKLFTGVRAISESEPLAFNKPFRHESFSTLTENDEDILACPPTLELAEIDDNFENDPDESETNFRKKRQKIPSVFGGFARCVYDVDGNLEVNARNSKNFKHPTKDGSNYIGRIFARAAGDPHFSTFDGSTFTFNGLGEFWMVKFSNESKTLVFKMQARMEQYVSPTDQMMNASVITAVAMEEVRNGEKVRVQVSSAQQRIFVVVDKVPMDIDSKQLLNDFTMRHKSCSIKIKKSLPSQQEAVIVTFYSGFSFQFKTVGQNEIALNIIGSANPNILKFMEGLLVRSTLDEGKIPGQSDIVSISTMKEIFRHQDIVSNYMIEENDSLLHYRPGESFKTFHKPEFLPNFEIESFQPFPQSVTDLCADHNECIFVYATTGSAEFANATRMSSMEYNRLVLISKKYMNTDSVDKGLAISENEEQPESTTATVEVDEVNQKIIETQQPTHATDQIIPTTEEQSGSSTSVVEVVYIVVYVLLAIILSSFLVLGVVFVKRHLMVTS